MKLFPKLRPKLKKALDLKEKPAGKVAVGLLGAAAVAAGLYLFAAVAGGPEISAANEQRNTEIYQSSLPLDLPLIDHTNPNALTQALQVLALAPEQEQQLIADLKENEIRLASFYCFDVARQDGDVIELSTTIFSQSVPLTNGGTLIVVPFELSSLSLTVTGSVDGFGGITAQVLSKAGPIPLPRLNVGQTLVVPVTL